MALGKKESKGQKYKQCEIVGCEEFGRIVARLGTLELAYCAKHRKKYGERVINALINARFNFKLTNFLSDVKKDLFMNPNSHLCEDCKQKEKNYIISKTEELEELVEAAENYGITEVKNVDKELDKIKTDDN